MTARPTIRSATPSDVLALARVRDEAILGIDAAFHEPADLSEWAGPVDARVRELETRAVDLRIVAESDGEIVGYGEAVFSGRLISAFYVRPSAGGRGIGATLVAALEQGARDAGLREVRLESSSNAEGFYRRLGYRSVDRRSCVMASGREMAVVTMRKILTP